MPLRKENKIDVPDYSILDKIMWYFQSPVRQDQNFLAPAYGRQPLKKVKGKEIV